MYRFTLGLLICFSVGILKAQNNSIRLTEGWEYVQGDIGSTWEAFRPETQSKLPSWQSINMPHCFNAFDAVDPDVAYYEGPGWYRTFLKIGNPYTNGRTILNFEGAGQKTEVYLYQTLVGKHVGGYDEFSIDITDAVADFLNKNNPSDGKIPIAIRCDNSRDAEMIPSDLSDFNIYGGLYRYVNLVYVPTISLLNTKVDYVLDDKMKNVRVKLSSELFNPYNKETSISILAEVFDMSNKLVAKAENTLDSWQGIHDISELTVNKPWLWSPDKPYLYQIKITISTLGYSFTNEIKTGFKNAVFAEKGPFYLNGQRLLLRGTHRHEDHAGLGAAMPEHLIRKEMEMMKEMGINFIRLGHYQQSRIVLDLCDELGILVWEEIPWCRGGLGGETYKEQARRMLKNMINQHYNHPSVILWGLGNENDWPGDFDEFDEGKIRGFMSELNDLAHSLDNKRMTSIRRCDFCKDIVDVYSPSIWAGWYRGVYTDYKEVSYDEAMKVDHFLHVEWGASNHGGRHSEDPDKGLASIKSEGADEREGDFLMTGGSARVSKDGDWSETYACNLIDWHLKEQETMDWLTGTAYWPFKDFSTPLRPENPIPYVNQKGVVQRDLTPKESFYVFQSYWTEKPMAHIYGHTWETRWGELGEDKLIKVYSNCSEAELFLNGESAGKRIRNSQNFPAAGLRWKVQFVDGNNHVKVIAKQGDTIVEDEIDFTYQTKKWKTPSQFKLEEVSKQGDTITICAKIYDEDGVFCPDSKELVEFGITGDGILLDNLGTWDGSRKIQLYNGRAFIKVKMIKEDAVISVKSDNIKASFLKL
jgi:beta-galactosidase